MMGQWYLRKPILMGPPEGVVLDTRALVKNLRDRISAIQQEQLKEELLEKEDRIVEMVVEALQFEKNIELELRYGCADVVRCEFGITERDQVDVISDILAEFGLGLYRELQRLAAYQKGYLYYQFHTLLGPDIVMLRLHVPELYTRR